MFKINSIYLKGERIDNVQTRNPEGSISPETKIP